MSGSNRPLEKRPERRDRVLAGLFSVAVHLIVLAALFWPRAGSPPTKPEHSLVLVRLADQPKPPGPPNQTEAKAENHPDIAPPPPPPRPSRSEPVEAVPNNSDILSDAQLAGAIGAGEGTGGGGGSCDMARAVQLALRRDPLVRTAVEGANRLGKSVMLWNGDWVQTGGQDGKGLSAVREAITWEVAFAPEACRHQTMHGVVLLSLADGNTRFAIGSNDWRWSDLLGVRRAPQDR